MLEAGECFGSKADIAARPVNVRFPPQKRTFVSVIGMSAEGQKRPSTVATNAAASAENGLLFDVGNGADIGDPALC